MIAQLNSIAPVLARLLSGSIDYAGVFPPAGLPLSQALASFNRYINGPESWIVGSIVLPINLLPEAGDLTGSTPARLTAIPRRADEPEIWLGRLQEDLDQLQSFLSERPQVSLQALEIALPGAVKEAEIATLLAQMAPLVGGRRVFLELPAGEDLFLQRLGATLSALEQHRLRDWGLKLRMGGLTTNAFPSTAFVAEVLATVRDHAVPIKFTAGLHHPLRHWNRDSGVWMHGFINVLMAGLFAHAYRLPPKNIEAILSEERGENFAFEDNVARWLDLPLRGEVIESLRRLVVSFGSCSVDEPLGDLRGLGWVL
jgi:hypothetical protein